MRINLYFINLISMSAYFRLELKQPSARGVEDQLISSDAVSSLARFEPSAPQTAL